MVNKDAEVQRRKKELGWAYLDCKWLSAEEAKDANKKRDALVKSLSSKVEYSFWCNKLHTGSISPGCRTCGEGHWSCLYVNALCTANCFYCPNDRKIKKEHPPIENENIFDDPDLYVDYLEKWGVRGVSFSGGEPLLVLDKILLFIEKIRERLGDKIYIWMYTNGDLVTAEKLRRLKDAGLNEIRFDIASRNYRLEKVELAARIMDTVSIEIPAIPEDFEVVKKCLRRMQDIGVKHLNLHQLATTVENYKSFIRRKYTMLHFDSISILESEMTALKIIQYAVDNKINVPINYCSAMYTKRLQSKGRRLRFAHVIKEPFEEITEAGYLRRLVIQDSPRQIKKMAGILRKYGDKKTLWHLNDANTIFVHSALLRYVDFAKSLIIKYFSGDTGIIHTALVNKKVKENIARPQFGDEEYREIMLNSRKKLQITKTLAESYELGATSGAIFQMLFIQNLRQNDILSYFRKNYSIRTKAQEREIKNAISSLSEMNDYERIEEGFPELY